MPAWARQGAERLRLQLWQVARRPHALKQPRPSSCCATRRSARWRLPLKAGWPFTSEIVIGHDDEAHNCKLEFDFGDDKNAEESGELVEFEDASLGACPICGSPVYEHGKLRVQQIRAHRPAAHAQLHLHTGGHPVAARSASR